VNLNQSGRGKNKCLMFKHQIVRPQHVRHMQQLPALQKSLYEAVAWNHDGEAVAELVRNGVEIDYVHPDTGHTALYNACMCDRPRAIEVLLQHGADPNRRLTYHSPVDGRVEADRIVLHYVSSADAAAVLIKAGADVNAADAADTTPLMCAAFHGHVEVVSALLAAGASPLARQKKRRGRKARTALELAESKMEFFQEAVRQATQDKNRDASERRLKCYEKIRDILTEAESRTAAA
jgi:Ankyrin repeats (3 copies)/Ankyrin repeats (many copies)